MGSPTCLQYARFVIQISVIFMQSRPSRSDVPGLIFLCFLCISPDLIFIFRALAGTAC